MSPESITASNWPRLTRWPRSTSSRTTRPASAGSTLATRAGSASTVAGKSSSCGAWRRSTSAIFNRWRNGEPAGTSMRWPLRTNAGRVSTAAGERVQAASITIPPNAATKIAAARASRWGRNTGMRRLPARQLPVMSAAAGASTMVRSPSRCHSAHSRCETGSNFQTRYRAPPRGRTLRRRAAIPKRDASRGQYARPMRNESRVYMAHLRPHGAKASESVTPDRLPARFRGSFPHQRRRSRTPESTWPRRYSGNCPLNS